jgi:hypothetical protein
MDLVNLAFHEAGHVFTRPFGETVHYLGGTLGQLAVPALLIGYFLVRARSPLGAAFSAWWLGESLVNVARYMSDARSLSLPLVGGGDHDWSWLFYRFGALEEGSVNAISGLTRTAGVLIMLLGLIWIAVLTLPPHHRAAARRRLEAVHPALGILVD